MKFRVDSVNPSLKAAGGSLLRLVFILAVALGTLAGGLHNSAQAASWAPQLTRYPYLTDTVNSFATVNFATDRSQTTALVRYGKVGVESCTANAVSAVRNNLTVAGVLEYQWKAVLRVEPGVRYCYRPYLGTTPEVDLLGADPAPEFTAQVPASSTAAFSFLVFGDWGYVRTDGTNPYQSDLMAIAAASGANFAVTVGDNVYPTEGFTSVPGQTQYGDLNATGPSTSAVFGSAFWKEPGKSIPIFPAIGNHGFSQAAIPTNHPHVLNFPQDNAAALSGGRYSIDTYCCLNGTTTGDYASVWYAIDAGLARIYVLEAAWADTNLGTADAYKNNYDYFFAPGTPQWTWLSADLASHPAAVKLAIVHYPLYSDNPNEPSNPYLTMAGGLEDLLDQYNVQITFSGHSHTYERNNPVGGNVITYLAGGGGAQLAPLPSTCSTWDAFGIGWSYVSLKGSSCGAAADPVNIAEVHHIIKVTVNNGVVTVEPINALGDSFDVQNYNFAAAKESNPPSGTGTLSAAFGNPGEALLSWGGSTDDSAVRGYNIYRDGVLWDYVTGSALSYTDNRAPASETHSYQVAAFDIWGNLSSLSNAATPGETVQNYHLMVPLIMR